VIKYTDEEIDKIIGFCKKRPHSAVSEPDGRVSVGFDIVLTRDPKIFKHVKGDRKIEVSSFRRILKEIEFREAYIDSTPEIDQYKEMKILLFSSRKELPLFLNDDPVTANLALFRIRKAEKVKE